MLIDSHNHRLGQSSIPVQHWQSPVTTTCLCVSLYSDWGSNCSSWMSGSGDTDSGGTVPVLWTKRWRCTGSRRRLQWPDQARWDDQIRWKKRYRYRNVWVLIRLWDSRQGRTNIYSRRWAARNSQSTLSLLQADPNLNGDDTIGEIVNDLVGLVIDSKDDSRTASEHAITWPSLVYYRFINDFVYFYY